MPMLDIGVRRGGVVRHAVVSAVLIVDLERKESVVWR